MRGGEGSLGQVRAPAPFFLWRPGRGCPSPGRARRQVRRGGERAGRAAAPRCVAPPCEGGAPLPAAGTGGQMLSGGSFFFCPSCPPLSPVTRRGERAETSCELRELAGLEGSGVRGFPSPSRVAGQGRLLSPPTPSLDARPLERGQEKKIKEGPTAMRLRDFHRRDPPPREPRRPRRTGGGSRGCSAGWACSRSAPLSVASAAAARPLEAPIAPSVAAVPRFPRRGGEAAPAACQGRGAARQRARSRSPGKEPGGGSAAPSLPSPGRCSGGGRLRAEERRGNGARS